VRTHLAFVLLTLASALPSPALAARLDLVDGVLSYLDTSGGLAIANDLTVSLDGDRYAVRDPADPSAIRSRPVPEEVMARFRVP